MPNTKNGLSTSFMIATLALLVPSCAVMAQTGVKPDPNDPCASQLGQQTPKGENDNAGASRKGEDTGEAGDRLARCGDVLTPPKTGDTELVKPAPETGKTPVIRPKVLPKQQDGDPDAK